MGGSGRPGRGAGEGGEGSSSAERQRVDAPGTPTPLPGTRSDAIALELQALMRQAERVVIVARESEPPGAPRPSLPVRAARSLRPVARGGYRLTRLASSLVGLVVVVAELLAPDHAVARAIFRALFE